jgi:hypothetical protein
LLSINGNWESVETLRDASRVVREYYNRELADEMDELIDTFNFETEELREELKEYKYMYEDLC